MTKAQQKKQQQIVEDWNEEFPVGQFVKVFSDSGQVMRTKTRSKAELLGGHTPVVWIDGISGCYALSRVAPILGEGY